jgi:hypothetical protein
MTQNYIHCKLDDPRHATWILITETHRRHQHTGQEAEEMGDFSFSFVPNVDHVEGTPYAYKYSGPPFDVASPPKGTIETLCRKRL